MALAPKLASGLVLTLLVSAAPFLLHSDVGASPDRDVSDPPTQAAPPRPRSPSEVPWGQAVWRGTVRFEIHTGMNGSVNGMPIPYQETTVESGRYTVTWSEVAPLKPGAFHVELKIERLVFNYSYAFAGDGRCKPYNISKQGAAFDAALPGFSSGGVLHHYSGFDAGSIPALDLGPIGPGQYQLNIFWPTGVAESEIPKTCGDAANGTPTACCGPSALPHIFLNSGDPGVLLFGNDCVQTRPLRAVSPFTTMAGEISCGNPSGPYAKAEWQFDRGAACDPALGANWLEKYRQAQAKLRKAEVLSERAQEILHERIRDNLKELGKHVLVEAGGKGAEVAAETDAALRLLGKLTVEIGTATAKKAAVWAEVVATLAALGELGYETQKDVEEARGMFREAQRAAAEGHALLDEVNADMQADLANDKLCQAARDQALAALLLDQKARNLVKEWEDENGTILDPDYQQPFVDFRAAMNKARQILTSRRESRPGSRTLVLIVSRQSSPAAESTLTALQVRACLDEIHRAEGFWAHAMANFARMLSAQEGLSQRLHVLLGDAIAKASAR